jgi:hypothetical protein
MKAVRLFIVICAMLLYIPCGFSQETVIRPYMGVSAGALIFAGSFDGASYFQTDEDILLVPSINPAWGLGGVVGIRLNNGAGEIGYYYYRSEYTTMENDYSGECAIHLIRVPGITKYLNRYADWRLNPYVDFEMSVSFSVFDKIAYPIGQSELPASGSYGAFILGLGGGTLFRISDQFSLDLKILADYYMGTDIRVKGRDRYEISKFGNLLLQGNIGLKYCFKTI